MSDTNQNKKDISKKMARHAQELITMFLNEPNPKRGEGLSLWAVHGNQSAIACSIICVSEMIKIQKDFYGLVLTQKFRDRVTERVEYLEQLRLHLESLK
jgi:hypothetical protein